MDLSRHMRQTATDDADSLHQNNGQQVNLEGVHNYLNQHLDFLKWDLLPTCHTTGGSPGRGPEVNSVKMENPKDFFRNVFVYNGHLCFLTEYHKARSSTNYAFYVAQFFPPIVGRILYTYVVYVRPYVEHLAARVHRQNQRPQNTYLFADPLKNEIFWNTKILTNALKRSSIPFTVKIYRHVAIGIIRRYIALLMDPLQNKFKQQFDLFAQAHILQTAHSLQVDSHYAMDQDYQTKCQPSILNAYFKASSFWWRWLNVDEDDFMLTRDASQDDQASSIAPTSIPGPIPPSSAPTFTFDDEDINIIDSTPFPDREPGRPITIKAVIPSKRASRKRQAGASPERPSRTHRGRRQPRKSLRSRPTTTEAPLSSDDEPLPVHRGHRGRPTRSACVERQVPAVSPTRSPSAVEDIEHLVHARHRQSSLILTRDASQGDRASSIVPTSILGPIPLSSAPTFTFDDEDTIIVDSTPLRDYEPGRPTSIEVIIPRKPTVTKRKASLLSILKRSTCRLLRAMRLRFLSHESLPERSTK
jgi:hypothetical protein